MIFMVRKLKRINFIYFQLFFYQTSCLEYGIMACSPTKQISA